MTACSLNSPFLSSRKFRYLGNSCWINHSFSNPIRSLTYRFYLGSPRFSSAIRAEAAMEGQQIESVNRGVNPSMKLLFVEMGVGYDQHGQDITAAAMRAYDPLDNDGNDAGSIPGVSSDQMKLQIKLGVPQPLQQFLDIERVKSVFPYGKIVNFDIVDGGLICSSGVLVEEMGDKNDDCYVVNAAVYVGY
ncbi:hypothetical protein HHK36_001765 [Tetracentron sinense]|uniref:Uncharacterized protein n=1 Tax=Tetracentron sinense TaxID=13715 RepID=A0A834ZWN7_TETSI|nr:hypothetical protein HHK36_001765 [Tetracentron sinense]